MRKQRDDLTGQNFGYLHVDSEAYVVKRDNGHKDYFWNCTCSLCGNKTTASTRSLRSGHKRSCGCLHRPPDPKYVTKHGMSDTRLYGIWKAMRQRCYDKNCSGYKDYGARGIKVCDEWRYDFQAFYDWSLENGYQENAISRACTLDRINTNGNYEPSNCQWADMFSQGNNRRNNHFIEYEGNTYTLAEAEIVFGVSQKLLSERLCRGMSVKDAIETPVKQISMYEYQGNLYTSGQLAKLSGLSNSCIISRILYGWPNERVVNEPLLVKRKEKGA